MKQDKSQELFTQAQQYIPGGVNSPVRAFKHIDNKPVFMEKAQGAFLFDANGKAYIDYVAAWGPLILGHNDPDIKQAIQKVLETGPVFGTPCALEISLAKLICDIVPNVDKIRVTNSGTEATMSAVRLARGYTNRNKIIKFVGSYHGHSDTLISKDNAQELNTVLENGGVTLGTAQDTLIATYNDLTSVETLFSKYSTTDCDIAAIIVEPVAGNMNCVPPTEGFLTGLRALCDKYNSLLIIDEVMTGFRVSLAGCQEIYKVDADLITFGKIIGGGLPIGAFAGKAKIMDFIAPTGPVYQGGTFCGNPITMAAGIACLEKLQKQDFAEITNKVAYLLTGLTQAAQEANIPFSTNQVGAMFGFFFTKEKVTTYQQVEEIDKTIFVKFYLKMLEQGIYLAPSPYESCFLSFAHTYADLDATIQAAKNAFAKLK